MDLRGLLSFLHFVIELFQKKEQGFFSMSREGSTVMGCFWSGLKVTTSIPCHLSLRRSRNCSPSIEIWAGLLIQQRGPKPLDTRSHKSINRVTLFFNFPKQQLRISSGICNRKQKSKAKQSSQGRFFRSLQLQYSFVCLFFLKKKAINKQSGEVF